MRARWVLALVAAAGLLTGCNSGTDTAPLFPQLVAAGRTVIVSGAARRAQAQKPPLTRAVLATVEGAYIEVTLERRDITGYLTRVQRRTDESPGTIETWRTQDDISLSFRNGVLIATRGLGGDVMSAELAAADGGTGPASGGERALHIRTGDLQVVRLGMACDLTDLGPESIIIVERDYSTRHLRETCVTQGVTIGGEPVGAGQVVNDYWIDSGSRIMRQSRQWAGPEIGYARIRRLTD